MSTITGEGASRPAAPRIYEIIILFGHSLRAVFGGTIAQLTEDFICPYNIRKIEYPNTELPAMDLKDSRAAAELLKAFSHPTRLAILLELVAGPKCVTDMEELLPARQANISQHLAVLRHAKLVDYAQDGSLRCYYLCRPALVEDMLALVGRNDPIVTRTPTEIQADKTRLAKALAKSTAKSAKSARREVAKR